jgi:hypothetical protein
LEYTETNYNRSGGMRKIVSKFWLVIFAVCVGVGLTPAILVKAEDTPATPSVIINEVAWAGSSAGGNDEWIELKNTRDTEVEITGWRLTRAQSCTLIYQFPNVAIEPHGFVLLTSLNPSSAITVVADKAGLNFPIANKDMDLRLYDQTEKSCTLSTGLVDRVANGAPWKFGGEKNGRVATMERVEPIELGTNENSWQTAIDSKNLKDPSKDNGTPAAGSLVVLLPTIDSIEPNVGEQGTTLTLDIIGTRFLSETVSAIYLEQNENQINGKNIIIVDSNHLIANFVIADDVTVGVWNVMMAGADGQLVRLENAMTIIAPPITLSPPETNNNIVINEVMPAPTAGTDYEFIELYNTGDQPVDLTGWQLDDIADGGSGSFLLTDKTITAEGFLTLYRTESKITLNDDGDTVRLVQPDGNELSKTTYTKATKGESWSRFDNNFSWTTSDTPNLPNVLTVVESDDEDDGEDEEESKPSFKVGDILISELLPNPGDEEEEFIELYNPKSKTIDLADWSLKDASGKTYRIGKNTGRANIKSDEFLTITQDQSGIALNNSNGETITLLDPNGKTIDSANYPDKAPVGAAYALVDDSWEWVTPPTPGRLNISSLEESSTPTVEIVAGEIIGDTLPVTGGHPRQRWGIGMSILTGGLILLWYKRNRDEKNFFHYNQ